MLIRLFPSNILSLPADTADESSLEENLILRTKWTYLRNSVIRLVRMLFRK